MEAKSYYPGLPSLPVLVTRISTSPWVMPKGEAVLSRLQPQAQHRLGRRIGSQDVQSPLTHVLGLFIAAQATPHIEGTGGSFIVEGGYSKNLIVVTTRHVIFPTKKGPNSKFERKSGSQPRSNNDTSYQELFASILTRIRRLGFFVEHKERLLKAAEGKDSNVARRAYGKAQQTMDEANETTGALYAFYQDVEKKWKTHASHVLGRVSPLPEGYSKDYAIIEGSTEKMYPNTNFKYPNDRLLKLDNIINDEELRHPTMLDQNDERCLVAIKNVKTTGVMSFYHIPKQWAILPYDNKFGLFSAPGDSSSVIVDGCGRIGGLLTGGAGAADALDVTATFFSDEEMNSLRPFGHEFAELGSSSSMRNGLSWQPRRKTIKWLGKHARTLSTLWTRTGTHILGYVVLSPPITFGTGTQGYTEDYAIIEHQGTITDEEMRHPGMRDGNDDEGPCLVVLKNGRTTGVTIGHVTGVVSFVGSVSWAILPYDDKSGSFSAPGDSGFVVVDGRGRVGGFGAGAKDTSVSAM
ncbi:hypothetical protein IW261DRAFT_1426123 [Armillaria novae-zelandiae]|uniref:Uncharacterized protein n=1 Tax=Armillaria novae-zelandiae TaxID=153914 RepID=A0AA39U1G2_9AGAR|nr:hypothetical protein IW261DRAFT_1426123 [Armillaria novae-zelandiae]